MTKHGRWIVTTVLAGVLTAALLAPDILSPEGPRQFEPTGPFPGWELAGTIIGTAGGIALFAWLGGWLISGLIGNIRLLFWRPPRQDDDVNR